MFLVGQPQAGVGCIRADSVLRERVRDRGGDRRQQRHEQDIPAAARVAASAAVAGHRERDRRDRGADHRPEDRRRSVAVLEAVAEADAEADADADAGADAGAAQGTGGTVCGGGGERAEQDAGRPGRFNLSCCRMVGPALANHGRDGHDQQNAGARDANHEDKVRLSSVEWSGPSLPKSSSSRACPERRWRVAPRREGPACG